MTSEQTFTLTDYGRQLETVVPFNADDALTLAVTNAGGSVNVRTDSTLQTGTVRVQVTRTDHGEFEEEDHHLTVKTEGNTISVHPDWQFASGVSGLARRVRDQLQHGFRPEDWNLSRLRLSPELDFHIAIALPASLVAGSQVKIRTASGAVDAAGFSARASIVTASGDVEATNLAGVIAIHTASGDVTAANITESLEINTASGDVTVTGGDAWLAARSASGDVAITGAALRNSRVTTVSGDIDLDAILNNTASYGMETVSGDVDLRAAIPAQGAVATLGFGTLSGSSDVGEDWEKRKRREWTIGSGETGPSVNVKTVSGDLFARARRDASVEARSLEMPAAAQEQDRPEDFASELQRDMQEATRDVQEATRGMKAYYKGMKEYSRNKRHEERASAPPVPPAPPPHGRNDSPIFTAGPSGHDHNQPAPPQSQPTEPVSPPPPFTDEAEPQPTRETAAPAQPAPRDDHDERLRVLEALEKGEIDIDDALARLEADRDQPGS